MTPAGRSAVRIVLALTWVMGFLLGTATPTLAASDRETLNIGVYSPPKTLDPHVADSLERNIVWESYEGLVGRENGGVKLVPRLATRWTISPDGKVYTFTLRKGVRFHDNTPLSPEAVKFSFERIKALKRGYAWALEPVDRIEALDDATVRITLKQAFGPFLKSLPFFLIVSPRSVRDHEEKPGDYAVKWYVSNGAGTGPYRLVEWQQGAKVIQERFADYWGGWEGRHVSRIVHWLVPEPATQRLMIEKGDLDVISNFTPDDVDAFRRNPTLEVLEVPSLSPMYVRLNMAAGPTTDKRVRQALSYAFNRKGYEATIRGAYRVSDGPVPAELIGGVTPKTLILDYDLKRAKELLAQAGYAGKPLKLSYAYNKGDEEKRLIGEILQAGLREIGVDLSIKVMTWPALFSRLQAWGDTRDAATAENSYGQLVSARLGDAYAYLFYLYHSSAQKGFGRNLMYYGNPQVDDLIQQGVSAVSERDQLGAYQKAAQLIADDVPDIFVQRMLDRVVVRRAVKGWVFDPLAWKRGDVYHMHKSAP